MMKYIYVFIGITLLYTSCSHNENNVEEKYCGVTNPIEDLAWLRELKLNLEKTMSPNKQEIIQYTYHKQTVFLVNSCKDCADNLVVIYNCSGEKICEFGGIDGRDTCSDFNTTKTNKILLWEN